MLEIKRKLLGFTPRKEEEGADGNGRGGATSDGRGGISDGKGNKDPGGRDGDSSGGTNDAGGEDPGDTLDRAEKESATHSRANYGDTDSSDTNNDGSVNMQEAFGLDTSKEVAGLMAGTGFADTDISEALSNMGYGYGARAGLVGPVDAAVTGPISRAAVGAASGLAIAANPALGLASSLVDSYQRGQLVGNQSELGGKVGGFVGSNLGADIGASFGPYGALAGLAIGGMAGSKMGKEIGLGNSKPSADSPEHGGGDSSMAGGAATAAAKPRATAQAHAEIGDDFYSYLNKWGAA